MKKSNNDDQAQIELKIDLQIRWFSVLAEHRGRRQERITVPENWTGQDLLDHLAGEFETLARFQDDVRLAVNHEFVNEDMILSDGDEVAFLTPVSGG